MKDPFASLGLAMYRLRYFVIPFWVVVSVAMAGLFATHVTDVLKGGGFSTPGSGSELADNALGKYFHLRSTNVALVVFQSSDLTVDDSSYKDQVTGAEDRIKKVKNVHSAASYYDSHDPSAISSDKRTTYMVVSLDGNDSAAAATVPDLRDQLKGVTLKHWISGGAPAAYDGATTAQNDVESAERLTFPVAIVLLLVVFGTAVSAALPLFLGAF